MAFIAIVKKSYENAGRNQNKIYINVVEQVRQLPQNSLADWIVAEPNHPWNDSSFGEFVVEITQQQFENVRDGVTPLLHDGLTTQPRFQQQNTGTGAIVSFGSWVDPENSASTWRTNVFIEDDRFILRMYDGDPLNGGVHIANIQLDEGAPRKIISLRLFNSNDTPSNTNAQNQKTQVGSIRMIFDFTAGITDFGIDTSRPGEARFISNHRYRIVGPNSEKEFTAEIFGRDLPLER